MKQDPVKTFIESYAERAGLARHRNIDKTPRLYYLCGAISKDPYAYFKFSFAETYLKAKGNLVINPLRSAGLEVCWTDALAADLDILARLKAIYLDTCYIMGKCDGIRLPSVITIDPPERRFDSPGSALEREFVRNVLPIIETSSRYNKMFLAALEEYVTKKGESR